MVNSTLRRRTPIRIKRFLSAALLASLFFMPALTGCQFLGTDMFPTTLSREEAVFDLDSKLADLGVTGEYEIKRMQFHTSPPTGKNYIFIQTENFSMDRRLLILDAEDLSVVNSTSEPTIAYALGIDDQGTLCSSINTIEIQRYNPETLTAAALKPSMAPNIPTEAFLGSDSTSSFLVWFNSISFGLQHDAFASGVATASVNWDFQLAATVIPNMQLRSLYYESSEIRMLFSSNDNGQAYIIAYPGKTALAAATFPIMDDLNATVTLIPSGDDQSGWLTRNGAIILTHENDTRLVRYESDSGKELDSFKLNDTEDTRFTFSADGTKWLMYNGLTGKLHLLRTWW